MIKQIFIFLAFILLFSNRIEAQPDLFININAGLSPVGFSHASWGDYDRDGDLDIVLTGQPGSTLPELRIYRNDTGTFTDINVNLAGLSYSTTEWGDYDDDGDLDLLVSGQDEQGNPFTRILRNDTGNFTDSGILLPGVSDGLATFGDFDNDGDLDILLAGKLMARIIRNDNNNLFTEIDAHLANVQSAFCSWVDYNNDGWLDAFVAGDLGGVAVSKLFKNNHGVFEEDSAGFIGLSAGCARWADLNNDGLKDLVLAGMDANVDGHFVIYKNNGNGQFTLIDNYTFDVWFPNIDIGDYDNDRLLDIIMIGKIQGCGGTAVTMLYHNEGNFVFSDASSQIQGFKRGSVAWGDYNSDGYNDLLFTGSNAFDDPFTEIYRNNSGSVLFTANTQPSPPEGLESTVNEDCVTFKWHQAVDNQTPVSGLSYNLYIGSSPGTANILSPASALPGGFLKTAKLGNANKDTIFTIKDLDAGTYYWSVQSVDNGFMGSAFATEQMFTVLPVGIAQKKQLKPEVYPNPCSDLLFFRNVSPGESSVGIYDATGRLIMNTDLIRSRLDLSGLMSGVYYIRIFSVDGISTVKLIKN